MAMALTLVAFILAISAIATVLENLTDRKFMRGLLIGGGATVLALAAAFFIH